MKGAGHLFLQPSGTNTDYMNSFEIENMEENVNVPNPVGAINADQIPQPTSSASGIQTIKHIFLKLFSIETEDNFLKRIQ